MMRTRFLALALTVLAVGCGGGDAQPDARPDGRIYDGPPGPDAGSAVIPEDLPDPLPSEPVNGSFVTFNAGLIQVVKGGPERIPLQVPALKALDADVLCLQEIYMAYTSPPAYAAMLADTYPYAYWTWEGQYQMRSGLLIVSKHPLYRGRTVRYDQGNEGPTVDRMAIAATVVDATDGWHANIVCTHLHAGLKTPDPATRLAEAQQLRTWAAEQNVDDGPSILLGDMNSGPVPPSYTDICECSDFGEADAGTCDNCDLADTDTRAELGMTWTDPWPLTADFFTSGREQFLSLAVVPGLFPDEPTQRIDHCMHAGIAPSAFVGDASGLVMTADPNLDVDGEILHYLSDHYGVRCTFAP